MMLILIMLVKFESTIKLMIAFDDVIILKTMKNGIANILVTK